MKGIYAGREPGATEGGEVVLLKATIVKAHDASNHIVSCAGETFNPSAQGLSAAEPTADELRAAIARMVAWERQEDARLRSEESKAKAVVEEREKKEAALEAGGVIDRVKAAVVSALTGGPQAP